MQDVGVVCVGGGGGRVFVWVVDADVGVDGTDYCCYNVCISLSLRGMCGWVAEREGKG